MRISNSIAINNNPTAALADSFTNSLSLQLDGVDEYVTMNNIAYQDFALSAWIKTSGNTLTIMSLKALTSAPTNRSGVVFSVNSSGYLQIIWAINNTNMGTAEVGTTLVNDGSWHHVAVSKEGTAIEFYVDGVNSDSLTSSNGTVRYGSSNVTTAIGTYNSGVNPFNGVMKDVAVWSNTDNELVDLVAIGADKPTNLSINTYPPAFWWRFGDSLEGDTYSDLKDEIGTHDGTGTNTDDGDIIEDSP